VAERIAVIGSGISGLSAAWLLARRHDVTLYEADNRLGGHTNTRRVRTRQGEVAVDTGFIVYNPPSYPNLVALLDHLGVESNDTAMTFAVSIDAGRLEYSGTDLASLFAQKRNLLRPRHWGMIRDILRFYREAPRHGPEAEQQSLGDYLAAGGYGAAFRDDHLLPMAAAIWSGPIEEMLALPAAAFVRFCDNHQLMIAGTRPPWRTVKGGSRRYIDMLLAETPLHLRPGCPVTRVRRTSGGVLVADAGGEEHVYDEVVIATHANQALRMLADPTDRERELLGAFRYSRNRAVLHGDASFMPRRRQVWSAWNYLGVTDAAGARQPVSVSYWMNRLQHLPGDDLFVTLNPAAPIDPARIHYSTVYEHPVFDRAALAAQREHADIQGIDRIWYAGAHLGAGFHEDGLQAGLAVAEAIGGVARPWIVENACGRVALEPREMAPIEPEVFAA
jgi:predicted NAD/FAD-binding protein